MGAVLAVLALDAIGRDRYAAAFAWMALAMLMGGHRSDQCKMRKDQDSTPRDHTLQRFIDVFSGAGWSL